MDYQQLAQALIDALHSSTTAGLNQLDVTRRNTFEDINNRGAKRGTLYSTAGANQQSRYDASTYLPGKTQLQGNEQNQKLTIQGNLLDTQSKIDALHKAASTLNGIDDSYFNSLLV
jgi:hypothetical protein